MNIWSIDAYKSIRITDGNTSAASTRASRDTLMRLIDSSDNAFRTVRS